MRKPRRETLQLPGPLRHVQVRRVLSAEEARHAALEQQVRAAYERGRIEGEQALSQQLVQQRQDTQDLFHGVLRSLREAVPQIVRDTEHHLISLTLEIARKIISDLPVSGEMIESAVRDALTQVEAGAEITVLLHPADLELLQSLQSPLLQPSPDLKQPRFHTSPDVTRGGCLIHTRFGTLDARRETKFDLLKRQLLS